MLISLTYIEDSSSFTRCPKFKLYSLKLLTQKHGTYSCKGICSWKPWPHHFYTKIRCIIKMFYFVIQWIWRSISDSIQSRDNNSQGYEIPTKRKQTLCSVLDKAFQAILKYAQTAHYDDDDDDIGTSFFIFSVHFFSNFLCFRVSTVTKPVKISLWNQRILEFT